ncbi:hypothetical protein [Pseudomonas sp. UBA2684]|uniref:hypothetical protein n=1 Tax=Pseudomonas sp. UBA2684 TaxID=1947311 RepID=UPI000E80479F|nr:hypothetical protein [Pseudomonas sp. UBA2684]HBX55260.1 hypothetical protein [Pseudomonas sp.]|tara:strand:+ start:194 stop:406 length:213 start_codon:yes stop_codon:yes gene_type:complete
MSRCHLDRLLNGNGLLALSALLLVLLGTALSREAVTPVRVVPAATPLQAVSRDNLAPVWTDAPRQPNRVF